MAYTFRKAGPNLELIGDHKGSQDSMQHAIASLSEVQAELRTTANAGAARSQARLNMAKNRTGRGIPPQSPMAKINVEHGDIDFYVELEHEHALSIEFGRPKKGGWGPMKGLGVLLAAFGEYGPNDGEEY
jgi:hypothetical protein